MPQDLHDHTGSIPSTSAPGTTASNGTAPAKLPTRRFVPAQISREGTALGAAIALLMTGSAAQLAGGLAEGGPLLTAGLACLGIHFSSNGGCGNPLDLSSPSTIDLHVRVTVLRLASQELVAFLGLSGARG